MTCMTKNQLLAEFLRNLSPFVMRNSLQFINIIGLHQRFSMGFSSGDCDGHCVISGHRNLRNFTGIPTCLTVDSVLFSIYFILIPPDIDMIQRAEKFHRSTEQNPKTYMTLCRLEPNFLVLLGQ